jgi:N-formylglutamate amidohydrolase
MHSIKVFSDKSFVEWVNRETIRYCEGDFSLIIVADFDAGFFSNTRVIKSSSIKVSNENKKEEIIDKIRQYFKKYHKKIRVEE